MGNENKAKRELVDLEVSELSVVDSAAIEEKFVVIKCKSKNQEGQVMDKEVTKEAGTTAEKGTAAPESKTTDVEQVPVEVEKAENDDVAAAMGKVASTIEGIAKQLGIEDVKKDLTPREVVEKQLKEAGLKEEALKKSLAEYDASAGTPKTEPVEKKEEVAKTPEASEIPVEKSEEEKQGDVLAALGEAIEKAKRFTPKREETLKNVVEELTKLVAALQPQTPKDVKMPKNNLPSNAQVNTAGLTTVTKKLEELSSIVTKAFEKVETEQTMLSTRIEGIEKARTPSKAVGGDSTDKEVVKKEKSIWGNIL